MSFMTTYAEDFEPCGPDCACAEGYTDLPEEDEVVGILSALNIGQQELAQAAYDQGFEDGVAETKAEVEAIVNLISDPPTFEPNFGPCDDPDCSCNDDESVVIEFADGSVFVFDTEGKSDTELIAGLASALGTTLDGLEVFSNIVGQKFNSVNDALLYLAEQVGDIKGTLEVLIEEVAEIKEKTDADALYLDSLGERVAALEAETDLVGFDAFGL